MAVKNPKEKRDVKQALSIMFTMSWPSDGHGAMKVIRVRVRATLRTKKIHQRLVKSYFAKIKN